MVTQIRILLVDRSNVIRQGLRALIETEPGLQMIGQAADQATAVELAVSLQPDVIILDLMPPEATDRNTIASTLLALKQVSPQARLLVFTNAIDQAEVLEALEAGAAGYMLKGTSGREMLEAIRDVFLGRQVLHPTIAPLVNPPAGA